MTAAPEAATVRIDLYSDTVTRPTAAMRQAIASAEVGNEQAQEDPTTNRLQARVAELLGQEAALFLPSGTMCNEIAYRVHCEPGDEIILDATGHALHAETGGPAALSGAMCRTIEGRLGIFDAEQLRAAIRTPSRHHPRSRLVNIENTCNFGGGSIWPIERVREVCAAARDAGLATHLDGARLLNAVVASGTPAEAYGRCFDSCWIDLSKGLGCPVGGVLAGSAAFIDRAWRFKHQFGGAMRQSGLLAAAGLHALDHHVERLADDHANARRLAEALSALPGIAIDMESVQTNMVYLDVAALPQGAAGLHRALLARGVRIGVIDRTTMRAVTHLDVSRDDIDEAARTVASVLAEAA